MNIVDLAIFSCVTLGGYCHFLYLSSGLKAGVGYIQDIHSCGKASFSNRIVFNSLFVAGWKHQSKKKIYKFFFIVECNIICHAVSKTRFAEKLIGNSTTKPFASYNGAS